MMKKKILFLSFNYPFGPFGPSTNCTTRIMSALIETGKYDIINLSYEGQLYNYGEIQGVNIETIPIQAPLNKGSRGRIIWRQLISVLFYPFSDFFFCRRVYKASKKAINDLNYDLVIAQCNPEESVWTGTWLKQNGLGNKLMVVFWDNVYGRMPRRIVPNWFALRRQRKAEKRIADSADLLVSLYPIKSFHEKYGDISEASNKRVYLGIPSIIKPQELPKSSYQDVIRLGMINVLYSGTIFSLDYVRFIVDLLNESKYAEQINLVFFERGVDMNDIVAMRPWFRGCIVVNDWIPLEDLLSIYPSADFFISFPGLPTAIRSKVYEYMSFGKPLLLLYDNDSDVNLRTFSIYPACQAIDMRESLDDNASMINSFFFSNKNRNVPFEVTEQLFPDDSAQAYVRLIDTLLNCGGE